MAQNNNPQPRTEITGSMLLFVGRKRIKANEPVRLQLENEIVNSTYYDVPVSYVERQSFKVFIGDRLFATVLPSITRRRPIKLVKPHNRHRLMELHLIKKNTTLH